MLTSDAEREISGRLSDVDRDGDRDKEGAVYSSGGTDFDGQGCSRDFIGAKVKQVFNFPFAKSNKKKKEKQTKFRSKRSGFSSSGKRVDDSGDVVCSCFCSSQPRCLESPTDDSKTSGDPNDPTFTYGMLKALIETNHFYSKECNCHSV